MKSILSITAFALTLVIGSNVYAQGGYTGPMANSITVEEAKKLSDDSAVVLTGKIERNLGGEKYIFTDATGSIIVEIDDEDWAGLTVGAEDIVEIHGEVDKDFTKIEIDVNRVVKK